MASKPDAFLSYTRFDDEEGEISAFRQRLSRTVRQVSGEPFVIFQDVDDEEGIGLGQRWKDKLDEILDQARFFIPILTPSFFKSEPCRQELRTFLDLEQKVGRRDLVLPIYWITCPVLEEGHLKARDELAQEIDERQRWDWRDLLFEPLDSKACRIELHALAGQIERARRNVLRVIETPKEAVAAQETQRPHPRRQTVEPPAKPSKEPAPKPSEPEIFRDIDEPWCPEIVMIPAGQFLMGSPSGAGLDSENPQHEVVFARSFALGRFPVTFEEYDYFCEQAGREKPDDRKWGRGRRPVINVSWEHAQDYCKWLSEITKQSYRLPSEAEWEYACRAGTTTAYAFGEEITEKQANFGGKVRKTTEAGSYPANGWNRAYPVVTHSRYM